MIRKMKQRWQIKEACQIIADADAVLVGAGAGLSAAAGLEIGERVVNKACPGYEERYGITNLYEGSFYPFRTEGERFAYWSRAFYYWRYQVPVFPLYIELRKLLDGQDYFVVTTNGDGQFLRAGFERERVFLMQGDHGDFACSRSCSDEIYDAKPVYESMIAHTVEFSVPEDYLPVCPHCGARLMMRQRSGVRTLEIKPYREEIQRYSDFLRKTKGRKLVLLELGVGFNTPGLIKIPFLKMAEKDANICYICVNTEPPEAFEETGGNKMYIQAPIDLVISQWLSKGI